MLQAALPVPPGPGQPQAPASQGDVARRTRAQAGKLKLLTAPITWPGLDLNGQFSKD